MVSSFDSDLRPEPKYINIMGKCFKRKDDWGMGKPAGELRLPLECLTWLF